MRNLSKVLGLIATVFGAVFLSAGMVFASAHGSADPALLVAADISSTTAIANIKLAGLLMIAITLATLGIKVARRMLS